MKLTGKFLFIVFCLMTPMLQAQKALLSIMEDEMKREWKAFQEKDNPPYYLDYRVEDFNVNTISSSFGSTTAKAQLKRRFLTVNVRIGDYERDNTHIYKKQDDFYGNYASSFASIPLADEKMPVAQQIWSATCTQYEKALRDYHRLEGLTESDRDMKDETHSFTEEKAVVFVDSSDLPTISEKEIDELEVAINEAANLFAEHPSIVTGRINFNFVTGRKYFVSSEGTKIAQNVHNVYLGIYGEVRTNEGMVLPLYRTFSSFSLKGIPSKEQMNAEVRELIEKLMALKNAPEAEPFSGPAIFAPRVAGVFFHEIFGHRIEGHRLSKASDSHTFKDKVADRVLPKFMNVISDPTAISYDSLDLMGYYKYDDQGIEAQKVEVVRNGVLYTFLLDRSPLLHFNNSNGHGRAAPGRRAVARQSNLMVTSEKTYSNQDLRKMLIKECKKQGKAYGYFFKDVSGGYTFTDVYNPNSFSINPTEVYRVYVDGRPDELVSGVDLIGTPLTMFSEIAAVGDETGVFSGHCGAESGYIPVTATAPSLFVKKIETQRRFKSEIGEPILSRPHPNKESK